MTAVLLAIVMVALMIPIGVVSVGATHSTIEAALSWALDIANDDRHGYVLGASHGSEGMNYDCSSFVSWALIHAGIDVPVSTTFYMRENFEPYGFEWINWSNIGGTSNLQRGDILLDIDTHVEFYYGNNQIIGAHRPATGISVSSYYNNVNGVSWDGVLRYKDEPEENFWVNVSGSQAYFNWNRDDNAMYYDIKIWKNVLYDGDAYRIKWGVYSTNYAFALPKGTYQAYIDSVVSGNQVYFDWNKDTNVSSYTLKVYKDFAWEGDSYETIWNIKDENYALALPEGRYQAYVDASSMSNVINFYVGNTQPSLNANVFGNQVYFDWTGDNRANSYSLKIYKGHAWQSEIYENIRNITSTNVAVALPEGTYQAYIDASGDNYLQMGNVIEFSVSNSTPSLKAEVNGNNVSFEWTKDNQANEYSLKVFKNHAWQSDPFVSKWNILSNSIDIKLPKGEYQAYIDASGDNYLQMGNVIDVVVKEDNYHSKISQEMVSMEYDETVFDGTEKMPNVVIMDNEYQLIEEYDYEVKYENNLHSGTAQITITGKGDYGGEILMNFRIKNCVADTNLDDNIDIRDVTAIQRHLVELEPFTEDQLAVADTNGDGEINIADATHLQMYLAEYDVKLG